MKKTRMAAGAVCSAWLVSWMPAALAAEAAEVVIEALSRPCMAGTLLRGATGLRFETCKCDRSLFKWLPW